jgi:RecB family exonuclease
MRHVWLARIERVSDWFTRSEMTRQTMAKPTLFEARGKAEIAEFGFTLTGKADRIDLDERGYAHVYDYKTGNPPSADEQTYFDKQLLLEAVMIEQGGFENFAPRGVERAVYIGLGATPKEQLAPLEKVGVDRVWAEFRTLIEAYRDPARGYVSRNAPFQETDAGDYDQLARFGEWDNAMEPKKEALE